MSSRSRQIYGNPSLVDGGGYPLLGFEMTYYLNPVSLDRNLEWDRKSNLCPDSGRLGERRP